MGELQGRGRLLLGKGRYHCSTCGADCCHTLLWFDNPCPITWLCGLGRFSSGIVAACEKCRTARSMDPLVGAPCPEAPPPEHPQD
jgi:hypothetical protein